MCVLRVILGALEAGCKLRSSPAQFAGLLPKLFLC